jgi:hypothetical protein
MQSNNDPGALGAHGAGEVRHEQPADSTNCRTSQTAAEVALQHLADIFRKDVVYYLNAAADKLEWLWVHGHDPDAHDLFVIKLRSIAHWIAVMSEPE